jgi:hypothetical protein
VETVIKAKRVAHGYHCAVCDCAWSAGEVVIEADRRFGQPDSRQQPRVERRKS